MSSSIENKSSPSKGRAIPSGLMMLFRNKNFQPCLCKITTADQTTDPCTDDNYIILILSPEH
jgi:hypothetical protein